MLIVLESTIKSTKQKKMVYKERLYLFCSSLKLFGSTAWKGHVKKWLVINDVLQKSRKRSYSFSTHRIKQWHIPKTKWCKLWCIQQISLSSNHEGNGAIMPVCDFPPLARMKKSNELRRQMFLLVSLWNGCLYHSRGALLIVRYSTNSPNSLKKLNKIKHWVAFNPTVL